MSQPTYPKLFSSVQAGRLALSNRLAMLPHGTAMVRDGILTDQDIAYYQNRSRDLGLVITGATVATQDAAFRARILAEGFNPDARAMMQKRCDVVHANGAKIVGQLCHLGRETNGMEAEYAPRSASAIRGPRDPYPPKEMTEKEIRAFIDDFAHAALNLQESGYDGVELHAAHGYLFAQFLSQASNQRDDHWGGSVENRLRLVLETIAATRELCRPDFAIGIRLSADEETADGLGIRDSVAIAQGIDAQGLSDYLSITIGMRGAYVKDATHPVAPAARAAGIIRKECGLPIIVGQKIQSPELAEQILQEGSADIIGMARALVADADFAAKARRGEGDRIRPCVGLNQDCRAFFPHLHCAVNPETGRETHAPFHETTDTPAKKKVAIVGGGPAGMEAARLLSQRGHNVTLFEASDALGGQFLLAASLPHRSGLLKIVDHLMGELRRGSVDIRLQTPITSMQDLASFDEVVLATGAEPAPMDDPVGALREESWFDILQNGAPQPFGSGHVVFADDGTGFWFSYGVAELLAQAGWRVTFLTPAAALGTHLPPESVAPMLGRLGAAQTVFRVLSAPYETDETGVTMVNLTSGVEEHIACDLLVRQTGRRARKLDLGADADDRLHQIGDCVTPRRISHALFEGQRLGRTL